jgi:hypothetical protein
VLRFTSLIAAAAILMHTTVGCCAHESHRATNEDYEHIDCHDAGSHDHDTETEHGPLAIEQFCECGHHTPQRTPHDCCHGKCNWIAPELQHSDELLIQDFVFAQPWPLNTSLASLLLEVSVYRTLSADHVLHALPVRPHLANCVFLI